MAILKRPTQVTGFAAHSPAGGATGRNYAHNLKHVLPQNRALAPHASAIQKKAVRK